MYGSGLGVLPTSGNQSGPGSGVSITGREAFLGFANSPAQEAALFNQPLTKGLNKDMFVFWGVLENPGDTQYNFKRYYFARAAGTYNPIPNVIGDDLLFISEWYPNAGTIPAIENKTNTVTVDLGDITGSDYIDVLNGQGPYDWNDPDLTYLVVFQVDEAPYLYHFVGENASYDGDFEEFMFIKVVPGDPGTLEAPTPPLQDVVNVSEIADKINLTENTNFSFGTGFNNEVWSVLEVGNKYLFLGEFTNYNGNAVNRIIMLNPDGTVYSPFNVGDGFAGGFPREAIFVNSQIYIVGSFTSYNSTPVNRVVSLNLDGTINTNFNIGTGFDALATTIENFNDKIYIGGSFNNYNSTAASKIVSLNFNGTINTSFVYGTGFAGGVIKIKVFSEKLYVIGNFSSYNSQSRNKVVSLNLDGTINTTFNVGTGFSSSVEMYNMAQDEFGRIYFVGGATTYNGTTGINGLVRLLPNGQIDNSFFNPPGYFNKWNILLLNERIYITGFFVGNIVRLNLNGTVDNTSNFGVGFNSNVRYITLLRNGLLITVGAFSIYKNLTENRALIIDQNGNKVTNYNASKFTHYNGRTQYFVDDLEQLEEYELVPKKLLTTLIPKRAIYKVNEQGLSGFNLTEKSNNIGVDFDFIRLQEGLFEVTNFDPNLYFLKCIPFQSDCYCNWSAEDVAFTTRLYNGSVFEPNDYVLDVGGVIIIEKY